MFSFIVASYTYWLLYFSVSSSAQFEEVTYATSADEVIGQQPFAIPGPSKFTGASSVNVTEDVVNFKGPGKCLLQDFW